MFITKKHLSRRTFLRAGGATIGLPLLGAMIPAATALAQTAAAAETAHGVLLPAARRDHGEHALRRGDESLDAGQGRPRLRSQADPRAVRGPEEIHDRRERPRQPRGRKPGRARDPSGHVAHRRATAAFADAELGRVHRSGRGTSDRSGHAAAVARSLRPKARAAARAATRLSAAATRARSRSARRRRRCRWRPIRAGCSSASSAAASRPRSARRSRTTSRACSTS